MDAWEREEEEWFISLIEEGKIVHDVKSSFSFKEVHSMLDQQKIYFALFARTFSGITFKKQQTFLVNQCNNSTGK